jgi:hypothetical protein
MIEKILSIMRSLREMTTNDEQTDKPMPDEVAKPLVAIVTELGEIGKKYPSPASKSTETLADLDKYFAAIRNIVGNSIGSSANIEGLIKSESRAERMEKNLDALLERFGVNKAPEKPAKSNALSDEGKIETKKNSTAFVWPSDLAEEIKKK